MGRGGLPFRLRGPGPPLLEPFPFKTLCGSNHTACRFTEKRGFPAWFGPGGAVAPPRILPFSKTKCSVDNITKHGYFAKYE